MHRLSFDWRAILSRAPLPALALAASYGVWSFNLLFVPSWVAFVSAAAFELTYIGLAVARLDDQNRKRASIIAASAVGVSVLYNVAAGLFHRRPDLLTTPPLWLDGVLAVMHGLPLAIVAYNVAALLLHNTPQVAYTFARPQEPPPQPTYAEPRLTGASPSKPCKYCGEPVDFSGAGRHGRNYKAFGNCQGVK